MASATALSWSPSRAIEYSASVTVSLVPVSWDMSWVDMYTYPSSLPPVLRMPETVRVTLLGSTFRAEAGAASCPSAPDCGSWVAPDWPWAPFEAALLSSWLTVMVSPALTSIVEAICSPTRTCPRSWGHAPSTNQEGFMACTAARSAPPAT